MSEGQNLAQRPAPQDVELRPEHSTAPGRWVDACHLQSGAVLLLKDHGPETIRAVTFRHAQEPVYNFQVAELHTYAVGNSAALVHNAQGCTAAEIAAAKKAQEAADRAADAGSSRVASDPKKGRFDFEHSSYDKALEGARRNAGDLGVGTKKMYDPKTGTLIGEMSADGKRGWRIDNDHVNYWDWTGGKKGAGGKYGHDYFPPAQSGPHSEGIGYAPWEE